MKTQHKPEIASLNHELFQIFSTELDCPHAAIEAVRDSKRALSLVKRDALYRKMDILYLEGI